MAVTLSLTEAQTFLALRQFLVAILPAGTEVAIGQENRVAEPISDNFVIMTPMFRERLSTNIVTTTDGFPSSPGVRTDMQPVAVTVQLDVHGPASTDNTHIITTLFRSEYATTKFAYSGFDVTPLYESSPRQLPFLNGEQQIEKRWSIDLVMQCNPVVTTPQDFAAQLAINLINVDVVYPPIG